MKICFINNSSQHLGLQSIVSVLKSAGHEVRILIDPQLFDDIYMYSRRLSTIFDYKNNIVQGLKDFGPDLVGLSVVTFHYQWACTMARMIKEEMDVPIIFGGIHPTSVPERVIKNDFVDMVCVGEGEYPMLELVNSMEKGQIDYSIKNIWFKRNGSVIQNEVRPLIEDLDSLPMPDNDLYYLSGAYFSKSYCIMTARGCPHACSYCCNSYLHKLYKGKGKYVRQRSVKNVIQELERITAIQKNRIKKICFIDDCFGYNINWLREFSEEYKKKIDLGFFCIMHPNHVSLDSLEYLKSSGCRAISLGIQTWDSNIREKLLERIVSNEIMEKAIRDIKEMKIEVIVDNLFHFPDYSQEDYIHSLMPYTHVKPTRNYFYRLKYYPNTTLAKKSEEKGWLTLPDSEDLYEGKKIDGLRLQSLFAKKDESDEGSLKMEILFVVMDLIPGKITRYIIKKKLYRYFPTILSLALLTILRTMICFDFETRIFRTSEFGRYRYFIKKMLFSSFKK